MGILLFTTSAWELIIETKKVTIHLKSMRFIGNDVNENLKYGIFPDMKEVTKPRTAMITS